MDTNEPSSPRPPEDSNDFCIPTDHLPRAPEANMIQASDDTQDNSTAYIASFNADTLNDHLDPDGQINLDSFFSSFDTPLNVSSIDAPAARLGDAEESFKQPSQATHKEIAGDTAKKAKEPQEIPGKALGGAQSPSQTGGDSLVNKTSKVPDRGFVEPERNTSPSFRGGKSTSASYRSPANPACNNADVAMADLAPFPAGNCPPNGGNSPKIKTEPNEPFDDWKKAMQSITINLEDSDDDENVVEVSKPLFRNREGRRLVYQNPTVVDDKDGTDDDVVVVNDDAPVLIKTEIDPDVQIQYSVNELGTIEIEDSDGEQARNTMFRNNPRRAPRTPAEIQRMRQVQKMLLAKAEAQTPNAWMWQNGRSQDDQVAADEFLKTKREYKSKSRKGKNSIEDDVNYRQAEKAEAKRVKLFQIANGLDVSDDTEANAHALFFPEGSPKRRADDKQERPRKKLKTLGKRSKADLAKEEGDSMLAGLPAALGYTKLEFDEKGDKTHAKVRQTYTKSKKRIQTGLNAQANSKGRKKTGNAKGFLQPLKSKAGKQINSIDSLLNGNVYEDANANIGRQGLPAMSSGVKSEAMKNLLASLDLKDKRQALDDKKRILEMTKLLGPGGLIRAAQNEQGWRLKGMTQVLRHHQVLGAGDMKAREVQDEVPQGGILADEMGFGKTVMTLMTIISNPAGPEETMRSTLIVCAPSLIAQWNREIEKHVDLEKTDLRVSIYDSKQNRDGAAAFRVKKDLETMDIVLTTYQEVLKSYPRAEKEKDDEDDEEASGEKKLTLEEKEQAWQETWKAKRGVLHRIHFYRIVLDEATTIKNHKGATSIACQGLMGKHRWVMSGTPILNSVDELYPYFKFLRVANIGLFRQFKENFCRNTPVAFQRLHSFLEGILIRRTHKSEIFNQPIIQLPENHQETIYLEFNPVERAIYDRIEASFLERIKEAAQKQNMKELRTLVLHMFLRLRQLTGHIFMLQETMEEMYSLEDIEHLYRATQGEVDTEGSSANNMVHNIRKMIEHKDDSPDPTPVSEDGDEEQEDEHPIVFKFRKYLRTLAATDPQSYELKQRSKCHKCGASPADDPYVTSCMHLYCYECVHALAVEAAEEDLDQAACLACGEIYTGCEPCRSLDELKSSFVPPKQKTVHRNSAGRPQRKAGDNMKWVDMDGQLLPSTKTAAAELQLEKWLKQDKKTKLIVFTQFHLVMKIFRKMCERRGWNHCSYHGAMSQNTRDDNLRRFKDDRSKRILIASLKCGGIGLNLTEASKVIVIDLWFNTCIEQQAFCRVFRIGQEKETYLTRFVVKNTIDERILKLQERKDEVITAALSERSIISQFSIDELYYLFGENVPYIHGEKDFDYSDTEDAENSPNL